ncbi:MULTISPECIES: flagellar FliJ family protein [Campylobacter]|uniref:Flagellar FliJ family protein n=1 Tax=Campylobacter porcelli TaxID=1660073 RepID=A0A1X9SVP0_9BACT|nr:MULTISPECIES: flagellar FliJ family protein [unclassified Campylobacter]ARR00246.1 putative flagellar protein FliJ [Campylobacter sp. RM6137]MCR8696205.1 flagellar FliJ family protein [Campylobacter sp. RM19073]MEE3744550.1 flagellar FliJ family protein [Campylobacter sp. CX2-4855-23]
MNNKFSQIVKVREEELNKIEMSLAKSKAMFRELSRSMDAINTEINMSKFPKSGSSSKIKSTIEQQKLLRSQKDKIKEKMLLMQKEIMHFESKYKKAYIELEKVKYMEREEIQKELKNLKKKESKELDELGTMRYSFLK